MPRRRIKPATDEPVASPFAVQVDTREQAPYGFLGLHADAREGGRPLHVETVVDTLPWGDYSIPLHHLGVAVERKSLADLFGTLGQGRERFVRELGRLQQCAYAAVVVEAEWSRVLYDPPPHSSLDPKTVFRSVIAWQQRYPRVHWWFCPDRRHAEVATYRILERYWRDRHEGRDGDAEGGAE